MNMLLIGLLVAVTTSGSAKVVLTDDQGDCQDGAHAAVAYDKETLLTGCWREINGTYAVLWDGTDEVMFLDKSKFHEL